METAFVGITCLLIGGLFGSLITAFTKARKPHPAPAPVDLGYDPDNPINRGRSWEPVEVEGRTFYRVRP